MARANLEILIDVVTGNAKSELNEVKQGISGVADAYGEMLGLFTKGAGAVAGVGAILKQAFDFGEAGAQIIQTEESFGTLLDTIGAAPDLLEQLQEASGGTVSELDLMQSTAKILAGTTGDLSTAMSEASPRLLEMARAAVKLDPSIQSVDFAYQSLATGIKRNSPLLIDNLNIVVKTGEANQAMADSLGKSVDELTAAEKQMALLNATLEAGDTLINQVGGNVDSAADEFARMDAEIEDLANNFKKLLVPILSRAAEGAGNLAGGFIDIRDALVAQSRAAVENNLTWEEYLESLGVAGDAVDLLNFVMGQELKTALDQAQAHDAVREAMDSTRRGAEDLTISTVDATNQFIMQGTVVDQLTGQTYVARDAFEAYRLGQIAAAAGTAELSDRTKRLKADQEKLLSTARQVDQEIEDIFSVSTDLSGPIARSREQLELFGITGEVTQEQVLSAIQNVAEKGGEEGRALAGELLDQVFVESQEIQVALDNITAEEAAQNIADELGVSLEEAQAKMDGIVDLMRILSDVQLFWTINISTRGTIPTPPNPLDIPENAEEDELIDPSPDPEFDPFDRGFGLRGDGSTGLTSSRSTKASGSPTIINNNFPALTPAAIEDIMQQIEVAARGEAATGFSRG